MPAESREVVLTEEGPMLVSGPIEVVLPDGRRVTSDRPVTALCGCRRSRRYPFCDASHRVRPGAARRARSRQQDSREKEDPC